MPKVRFVFLGFLLSVVAGCGQVSESVTFHEKETEKMSKEPVSAQAIFAGGCFWCMEAAFEKVAGVVDVVSGYTGGKKENPTYIEVSLGKTGHREAVLVSYDPLKITYSELLDVFWRQINPTDPGGQFVDRGPQYSSAIFYFNETQRKLAVESKEKLEQSGKFDKPILTPILEASEFYPAEEYHQGYYQKNPLQYKFYQFHSGRIQYVDKIWGHEKEDTIHAEKKMFRKPSNEVLRQELTPLQYYVTQQNGTEPAFRNEYWDNKKEGIYVDIVSGEPLFSSLDKFDSGTGWPSFTKPLQPSHIIFKEDSSFSRKRTEVRSRYADSHLGHVFSDGPPPTGLRYCINSAALRFIPTEKLQEEGYAEYQTLFE